MFAHETLDRPHSAWRCRSRRRRRRWGPTTRGICSTAPASARSRARSRSTPRCRAPKRSSGCSPAWRGSAQHVAARNGSAQPIVPPRQLRQASPEERKAFLAEEIRRGFELRTWWLEEMLHTRSPLTERMTLFWHNHFVSSQQKVRYTKLMYEQNVLLRRHAVGNFGAAPARRREGPGDGDLSRLGVEPQGQAERELRARGDGALHPRRRALHRSRRPRGGARLHRLVDRPGLGGLQVAARAARRRREDRARAEPATSTATRCSTSCSRARRPRSSS